MLFLIIHFCLNDISRYFVAFAVIVIGLICYHFRGPNTSSAGDVIEVNRGPSTSSAGDVIEVKTDSTCSPDDEQEATSSEVLAPPDSPSSLQKEDSALLPHIRTRLLPPNTHIDSAG
jgi:hypothetical protein